MIKAVLFDLDGTLINTLHDLFLSTNVALRKNQLPERSEDEIRRFVGNGVRKLIERSLPAGKENLTEIVLKDFKEDYQLHSLDHSVPYPGILALLKELKDEKMKLAVVSNKFHLAVKEICDQYFHDYLDYSIGESPQVRTKPHPDMIFKVMETFQVSKEEIVLVGDSETDVETAKNAGISVIGVNWGFRGAELLKKMNVDYLVYQPQEIVTIIKEINQNDKNMH